MSKMSHCFFHKIWYIFLKYFNAYISYNAHFIRLVTFFVKKNNAITQRYNAIFINQTILVLFYHYFISLFHKWLKFNISAILLLHFNVWRCYFEFSQNQCHNFIFFLSKNRLIPNKIGVSHVIPHRPHVQSSLTPVVSIILVIYIYPIITFKKKLNSHFLICKVNVRWRECGCNVGVLYCEYEGRSKNYEKHDWN